MLSIQGHLIRFMLQNRHLFQFRLKKEIVDWSTYESILRFRSECEAGARRMGKLPADITVKPVDIGGARARIYGEWILPSQDSPDRVIFYCHGGGYVTGSSAAHRAVVAKFVRGSQVGALVFDYRLAPEHPFPAALDDTVAAYRWLLTQGVAPARIVIAGESAGGGLVLATLLALRDQGIPLPAAAVAISPWTDLKCSGDSFRTKAKVCLSPAGCWTAFSKYYTGDNDPGEPLISPLYGELRGLPPLYISVGGDEVHHDGAVDFTRKAEAAGVNVTLRVGEGLFHCYPACAGMFPEATRALAEICEFIKKHIH